MKAVKIILNVLGIITAVFLSIVLCVVLFASPVISAASSLTKPKTIHKIITSIDYSQLIPDDELDLENEMSEFGAPAEVIDDIMKSKAVKDFIELYSKDAAAALSGKTGEKSLNRDALIKIANDNIEEIADIFMQMAPEEEFEDHTPEEIKAKLKEELIAEVEQNADEIIASLPDVSEIVTEVEDKSVITVIKYLQNGTFNLALWITILLFALAIYGCRWPKFKGFRWLSIVFSIGATVTIAERFLLNGAIIEKITASMDSEKMIVTPTLSIVTGQTTVLSIVFVVLAAAFMTAFVLLRVYTDKKNALAATQTEVVNAENIAVEPAQTEAAEEAPAEEMNAIANSDTNSEE
ncbi:MAG: hypothetical protein IJN65_05975 [Clostridia bacterium]|nr:hypothetical protein [Clostridia bacterium]